MSYPSIKAGLASTSWSDSPIRRLIDITVSMVALILLLPIFLVVAAAVKATSKGPVFFKQARNGKAGVQFNILKFRSMVQHEQRDFVKQATGNDPRVTRVGAFLRKTSLDELPQLINVLYGDMSLIGPRPHAISHDEYYSRIVPNYLVRQMIRPGITGLAQCMGFRGETIKIEQMQQRVDADMQYVLQNNPIVDFQIILRTVLMVLGMKNAH